MASFACKICPKSIELQGIFNSLHTAVLHYGEDGRLAGANQSAKAILPEIAQGLGSAEEFIRFVYDHSIESSHHDEWLASLRSDLNERVFYEVITLRDSKFYLVRAVSNADKSLIVELSDISLIKSHADDLLQLDQSNQILVEAIQSSPDGLFIAEYDDDRRIIFANRSMNTLLGISEQSLVGYSVDALLASQFAQDWNEIRGVLDHCGRGEFWKHSGGVGVEGMWLSLSLFADRGCGSHRLIIGTISDETQKKIHENQMRQTQKLEAIGKLAGGVAHDFNNILSIVEGYVRLSESALKRGEDVAANFSRIKQAVARGSGLTKQLLMFGKHRVTERKVIDLCAQVREMEHFLQPLLGVHIQLHMVVEGDPVPVFASADNISQIVMNLVLNARDAMPDGGEIVVSVHRDKKGGQDISVLKVVDSGTGIPADIIEKIFDPFFTTKEQGKGTGLGLSMVYGLIQQMGGSLDVDSVVGEGTAFTISLPVRSVSELDSHKNHAEGRLSSGLRGKTILVAEDEADLLMIMEATLMEFEMNVLKARNGNEALQIQDEYDGDIDFLLTDMVMPELGGLKLAELMQEVRPETRVLFMSGYPVRGEISNIELPEDATFMAKPVQPDFLRQALEQIASGQSVDKAQATVWHS